MSFNSIEIQKVISTSQNFKNDTDLSVYLDKKNNTKQQNISVYPNRYIKVSVIMPLYNDELYLAATLDSLLAQTLKEIEIIIVDDCSTDKSLEIAMSYAARDSRITVYSHTENKGGGAARNTGMQYAKGEYLSFLDSDDYFYSNMLEASYSRAKQFDADICVFNTEYAVGRTPVMNFNVQYIPKQDVFKLSDVPSKSFEIFNAVPWNKLFRHEFVANSGVHWSETFCSNDVFFVNTHLVLAERICVLNDVLIRYENRTVENSQSKYNYYFKDAMNVYASMRKQLIEFSRFDKKTEQSFISRVNSALNWQFNSIDQEDKKEFYFNWLNSEGFVLLGLTDAEFGDYLVGNNLAYKQYLNIQRMMKYRDDYEGYRQSLIDNPINDNYCPVAFAINEPYAFPFSVCFLSLLENRPEKTFVDAYVLVTSDFSEKVEKDLHKCFRAYSDFRLSFVRIDEQLFADVEIYTQHLDIQTFFRLVLPNILPHQEKVLYLDSDAVITGDIFELFNRNIESHYIMGVKAAAFMGDNRFEKRKQKELQIPSMKQYVNAGMLMMNLNLMRRNDFVDMFMRLMANGYHQEDQDVINKACFGKIRHLPLRFNAMIKYLDPKSPDLDLAAKTYSKSELQTAEESPVMIHYANKIKPWENFRLFWSERFFSYAKKSELFENPEYYPWAGLYRSFLKIKDIKDVAFLPHRKFAPNYDEILDSAKTETAPATAFDSNNVNDNEVEHEQRKEHFNTKISVILPVYNAELTLAKTLESLVMNVQAVGDSEVIIVDDNSYDRTLDLALAYAEVFPFIKVYSLDENTGSGCARNFGISKAKGEFISFMDGDDEYYAYDSLKTLYDAAKENGALICGGTMAENRCGVIKTGDYTFPLEGYEFKEEGIIEYKDWQFDYGFHRFIFNRKFLNENQIKFPEERRYQDVLFLTEALSKAELFYAVSKPIYVLKIHETRFTDESFIDFFRCLNKVLDFARENSYENLLNLTLERYLYFMAPLRETVIRSSDKGKLIREQLKFIKKISEDNFVSEENCSSGFTINGVVGYYYPHVNFSVL